MATTQRQLLHQVRPQPPAAACDEGDLASEESVKRVVAHTKSGGKAGDFAQHECAHFPCGQ